MFLESIAHFSGVVVKTGVGPVFLFVSFGVGARLVAKTDEDR